MVRKFRLFMVVALTLLLVAPAAHARLTEVGPINPNNGFPTYYRDANGVAIELTAPPFGDGATPPTMIFDPAIAGNTFSEQIGFGSEAFYYNCTADKATFISPIFGDMLFELGLEATFNNATGEAEDGQQIVFSRLRTRFKGAPAGTYTLRHPYGVVTLPVTADDVTSGKGINYTRDIGVATLNFTGALEGDIGPFLRQVTPAPVIPPGTPAPFNVGWIGDGVTVATIGGSPFGYNKVRLEGPAGSNIGGAGVDFVETNLFVVSGHRFAGVLPTPLTLNRVTYTRDASGTWIDVFANSLATATMNAFIPDTSTTPILMNKFNFGAQAGMSHVRVPFDPALPLPLVKVTATAGTSTPTTLTKQAVDLIRITTAEYNTGIRGVTVRATSSDTLGAPILAVTDPPLGNLTNGYRFSALGVPVPSVTVTSSAGGKATLDVKVITP